VYGRMFLNRARIDTPESTQERARLRAPTAGCVGLFRELVGRRGVVDFGRCGPAAGGVEQGEFGGELQSRDHLYQQFAKSEFADQAQGVEQRAVLTKTRIALSSRIDSLAAMWRRC
jgi:hypothetical protein